MLGIFSTPLLAKIWFDLWGSKQRTIQAVLTITIGSFVIGAVFGGWGGISADTETNYGPTNPPSINVRVNPPADQLLIEALRSDERYTHVEGLMEASIKWRPHANAAWQPAILQAREDYTDQQLSLLRIEQGSWPTGRQYAVERGFAIKLSDRVELEVANRTTEVPISGVFYNLSQASASLGGDPIFYTSRAQFAALTGQDRFGRIIASVPDYSAERAAAAAEALEHSLNRYGFEVQPGSFDGTKVSNPNRAFFQDPIESVGLILQSIGIIAVVLGLLLVYNTVTAIVTQQTAQIGELKAIGATSGQILLVYYSIVFAYGLIALLISVPLGLMAANNLRQMMIGSLGLKPAEWLVLPLPIIYQVGICLVAPMLVATIPVLQGARITVREAISSYGLSGGGSWIDTILARFANLPSTISLAFSNAFRNLGRVTTTQLALAGAGLTFMAVVSARASLIYTLGGVLFQAYPYQIQINLTEPVSLARAEQIRDLPQVAAVESWRQQSATMRLETAEPRTVDPAATLSGVPLPAQSYTPKILSGRMLQEGDTYAVVLHEWLARDVGAQVGDWVVISIPDPTNTKPWISQQRWQVVGVLLDASMRSGALVPRETLFNEIGRREVNRIQILSRDADPAVTAQLATQVRAAYHQQGIDVVLSDLLTITQRSDNQLDNLATVITLLLMVAMIVAVVGAISLNGTLSISVLERRREIGVLRAIGATPGVIRTQFLTEGLLMGLLSWLIGLVLSYPVGLLTVQAIGFTLRISVIYQYDWTGVWLWLGLATIIAIIASLSPAQQAIRTSVQESLAYE
ncbi:MAG: FtsX-like permease family protein [Roseiflexaceae bacterium]